MMSIAGGRRKLWRDNTVVDPAVRVAKLIMNEIAKAGVNDVVIICYKL